MDESQLEPQYDVVPATGGLPERKFEQNKQHQGGELQSNKRLLPIAPDNTLGDASNLNSTRRLESEGDDELYELNTTFQGGQINDGYRFDVRVSTTTNNGAAGVAVDNYGGAYDNVGADGSGNSEGIVILSFDILTPLTADDDPLCLEIYTKDGSFEGYEFTPLAWTCLGSVSVLGEGQYEKTNVPICSFDPVYVGNGGGSHVVCIINSPMQQLHGGHHELHGVDSHEEMVISVPKRRPSFSNCR